MVKKRAIVSYEKLTLEQKKKLEETFPDGYSNAMTKVNTPTGETLDAILWETEEIIYLVKLQKAQVKPVSLDDDTDDDDALDDVDVKIDDEDEDIDDDEDDDSYDDDDEDDDDEDDE